MSFSISCIPGLILAFLLLLLLLNITIQTSATTLSSSGVVLSNVNLQVQQVDANAPPCVGAHCRQLSWVMRVQKLPMVPAGIEGRFRPNTPVQHHAERTDEEAMLVAALVGTRVTAFISGPDGTAEGTRGNIVQYDSRTGNHLFVSDSGSHHWLPLRPRTSEQHAAQLASADSTTISSIPPTALDCIPYDLHTLQAPATDSAHGVMLSQSFFSWLALPANSFVVNLNPSQPHLIIDSAFSETAVGQILLEADLLLKNETAFALHPDSPLGWAYWQALDIPFPTPELCLNFRTWIVPSDTEVEIIEMGDTLYITHARLSVQEESDYLTSNFAYESTKSFTGCAAADPAIQAKSETLFKSQVLPSIIDRINTAPEFEKLRTIFYWRVVAEWYKRQGEAVLSQLHLNNMPKETYATYSNEEGMSRATAVFQRYVEMVREGAYSVKKVHQVADGRKFARTYAQGRIDLSQIKLRVHQMNEQLTFNEL